MATSGALEFYKLSAQIIPALFIGVVLQSVFLQRFRNNDDLEGLHMAALLLIAGELSLAEYIALNSIYANMPSPHIRLVAVPMASAALFMLLDLVLVRLMSETQRRQTLLAVLMILLFTELWALLVVPLLYPS